MWLTTRFTVLFSFLSAQFCPGPPPAVTCIYDGEVYEVGDLLTPDRCRECRCEPDGRMVCVDLCGRDDSTGQDAGSVDHAGSDLATPDAGSWDRGSQLNEVVPYSARSCELVSVNGAPPDGAPAPGDQIVVTAANYLPATPGSSLTGASWQLLRAPPGSRTALRSAAGTQTSLGRAASGSNRLDPTLGPDLSGSYLLRATVNDDQGGEAVRDCALDVRPHAALQIELVWDRDGYNADLRLARGTANGFCAVGLFSEVLDGEATSCDDDGTTCYFGNCRRISQGRPDWDGDGESESPGDPLLLADVSRGFGPEVIQIQAPVAGTYLVGVHLWSGAGAATQARAAVWVQGQLWGYAETPLAVQQWWEPFVVTWPASPGAEVCVGVPGVAAPYCAPATPCQGDCPDCPEARACGPGTECDPSRLACLPASLPCLADSDCDNELICAWPSDSCLQPGCGASACANGDEVCDPGTALCVPDTAPCVEPNEPNNTLATATDFVTATHTDTLCRGDVDLVRIQGHADTQLFVAVDLDIPSGTTNTGVSAALLDAAGAVLDTTALGSSGSGELSTTVSNDTALFVRLDGGLAYRRLIDYTLRTAECTAEAGEPNDEIGTATGPPLTAGSYTRTLCGLSDKDFYLLTAPDQLRTQVTVTYNSQEGDINATLLRGDGTILSQSSNWYSPDAVYFNAVGGEEILILQVDRVAFEGDSPVMNYRLDVVQSEIPDCNDGHEPNQGTLEAAAIGPGTYTATICDGTDSDFYRVTLVDTGALSITVRFTHSEGDIDLRVRDGSNNSLETSQSTTDQEQVSLPSLPAGTYYIEVYPYSINTPPQPYTMEVDGTGFGTVADGGTDSATGYDSGE